MQEIPTEKIEQLKNNIKKLYSMERDVFIKQTKDKLHQELYSRNENALDLEKTKTEFIEIYNSLNDEEDKKNVYELSRNTQLTEDEVLLELAKYKAKIQGFPTPEYINNLVQFVKIISNDQKFESFVEDPSHYIAQLEDSDQKKIVQIVSNEKHFNMLTIIKNETLSKNPAYKQLSSVMEKLNLSTYKSSDVEKFPQCINPENKDKVLTRSSGLKSKHQSDENYSINNAGTIAEQLKETREGNCQSFASLALIQLIDAHSNKDIPFMPIKMVQHDTHTFLLINHKSDDLDDLSDCLIIDPWAVTMGYDDTSGIFTKDNYPYPWMLNNLTTSYDNWKFKDQGRVIKAINAYFKANNLEIRADPQGICHGLAAVFCQYALENKEAEFNEILENIVQKDLSGDDKNDPLINSFMQKILYVFNPVEFNKKQQQRDSITLLSIDNPDKNNKKQKHAQLNVKYTLTASTSPEHWAQLFRKLRCDGATYLITDANYHSISMKYTNNPENFRVYDPNHSLSYQDFSSEKDMMQHIQMGFHWIKPGDDEILRLPFVVQVVENPYHPLDFKSIPQNEIVDVLWDRKEFSKHETLAMAIKYNEIELVEHILKKANIKPDFEMILTAVKYNAKDVFSLLIKHAQVNNSVYQNLCSHALLEGLDDMFDLIQKSINPQKKFTLGGIEQKLMENATASGNFKCIIQVCQQFPDMIKNKPQLLVTQKVLFNAITSGKLESLNFFLEKIYHGAKLNDNIALKCLQHAIASNQYKMVHFFLKNYSHLAKSITISRHDVQEKNLMILESLEKAGAKITPIIKKEMTEKRKNKMREEYLYQFKAAYLRLDPKALDQSFEYNQVTLASLLRHAKTDQGETTLKVLEHLGWIDENGNVKKEINELFFDNSSKTNFANSEYSLFGKFKEVIVEDTLDKHKIFNPNN